MEAQETMQKMLDDREGGEFGWVVTKFLLAKSAARDTGGDHLNGRDQEAAKFWGGGAEGWKRIPHRNDRIWQHTKDVIDTRQWAGTQGAHT
jgi:hypothetical protein